MSIPKSKIVNNPVNHPSHYTNHASGVEAIEICGYLNFCLGNAFKYVFRFEKKWSPLEDLKKAKWYIARHHFQSSGKTVRSFRKFKDTWKEDYKGLVLTSAVCDNDSFAINVKKVVENTPGNIGKALFYIAWRWDVCKAYYYINMEIKNRKGQNV